MSFRLESLASLERAFGPPMVTLYDQFGRPIYVPSSQKKIGDTITLRPPARFRVFRP
jgi:hypothetical protein